jgi:glycosyltransferase involved in cell wall biosynthesis
MGNVGKEQPLISVIVPNRNSASTIGKCLEAALRSGYRDFEVVVADDCSTDGSVEIIHKYPVRLVRLNKHSGAAAARNEGARAAKGKVLFFIDSDCIMQPDTIEIASKAFHAHPEDVSGGTYTPIAHDRGFFSTFQSLFVNYSETKNPRPDYVATHAMVISKILFDGSGGFDEEFMPILEDVEFSHRLRRMGVLLRMRPALQVEHIFNFNLWGSLKNAFRKSFYWTMYSLKNRDLFKDSGTASFELKTDVVSWLLCASLFVLSLISGEAGFLAAILVVCGINLIINRKFIGSIIRATGPGFTLGAVLYYTALYPLAVAAGGFLGTLRRP